MAHRQCHESSVEGQAQARSWLAILGCLWSWLRSSLEIERVWFL